MATSILKVLTELTALSSNGITILKPFRPWYGLESWRGRTVGLRLLNAGEMEQVMEFIATSSTTAQDQAFKKEVVARSLWTVDKAYVAPKESVEAYNEEHKSELSELEYKRVFINGFEQYLVEYLYTLYTELQQKQARKVFGMYQCCTCKKSFKDIPTTARRIKFNTAEIICDECLPSIADVDMFDFEASIEVPVVPQSETPPAQVSPIAPAMKTPADFESLEDYQTYLIEEAERHENVTKDIQP